MQKIIAALVAGQFFNGDPIVWQPNTPIAVQPGRFLHLFCRCLVGTATATETFLWQTNVDGWFD